MQLSSIIEADAILIPLQSKKRDDAIGELADALTACRALDKTQSADARSLALKREKRGSTGFGHGVAVPHARLPWERKPLAAFGLAPAGIDFKALDREPVRAVFFLVTPEGNPDLHVAAMEAIFGALGNERFRKFLHQVDSSTQLRELIGDLEAGTIRAG